MFQFKLETFLFRAVFNFIRIFPLRIAYLFSNFLIFVYLNFVKTRLHTVESNLHKSFPQKSPEEIKKLTKQVIMHFGRVAVEFCWFSYKSLNEKLKVFEMRGFENVEKALEKGKGIILFMGHFGNWEMAAQILSQKTEKMNAVAKQQKNQYFDDFITHLREFNKISMIPKKFALRGIIKALTKNNIIFMLGDQNGGKGGIPAEFFGRNAPTNPGTAKISLKFDCPIVFSTCLRQPNRKYIFKFEQPIYPKRTQSLDRDVSKYTQLLTSKLEDKIRENPEQWFWFHRRWKQ